MGFRVEGLRFRVHFRVQGIGFRVHEVPDGAVGLVDLRDGVEQNDSHFEGWGLGLGFRVDSSGLGFGVWGSELRV